MANTYSIDLEATSSQYLSAADSASLDITGALTFEAWVRFESDTGDNQVIGSKWDDSGNQRSWMFRYNHGTTMLSFTASDTGVDPTISNSTVTWTATFGTYYHLAVTYATSGEVKFYVNGVQQGATQTGARTSLFNSSATFKLGARNAGIEFLDGLIDDARLWNVVRTVTEINDNKCTEIDSATNLQGSWHLNNSLSDSSGNSNTLTNNNSATFVTTVPDCFNVNRSGFFMAAY